MALENVSQVPIFKEAAMNIPELFGSNVFNDTEMRKRLPKDVYESLYSTIEQHQELDIKIANEVAEAMKNWAIERGATHYTHWFQPMTGITAEKHDGFINPQCDGTVIMEFSGKELIKGESDASSFPSGGIRATFEARGYTAWDPTSYAFIKDDSLCIPTVFCSYTGEMLDQKTPLLKSVELISNESLRLVRLFGDTETSLVSPTVGAEQEYFLIDKELYDKRTDIKFTGRTLFGAMSPKGQELEDHYYGAIKPRIKAYMKELDEELWKLGVYAKTEHNEVAPAQHELAPVYCSTNIASDHNHITMELMKKVALNHGLVCLLHEKPFKGVNGSGKHNNWSLGTDTGINLFKPGKKPYENKQFLIFLAAVIRAVDEHQDLLRFSVASAGNDLRLGGDEAPPAIVSVYLGDEIEHIVNCIKHGVHYDGVKVSKIHTGVNVLPDFKTDTADRNRTSPFAFTGNKFEFRMLGSSMPISLANVVLNTITADVIKDFADRLEKSSDFNSEVDQILKETFSKHSRIIFSGNNYSEEWVEEARKRGLLNLESTVQVLPYFASEKNIALFEKHKIFSAKELRARSEIAYENYYKILNLEARTMLDMINKDILPAVMSYSGKLADILLSKKELGADINSDVVKYKFDTITDLSNALYQHTQTLKNDMDNQPDKSDVVTLAEYFATKIKTDMKNVRAVADELEINLSNDDWPFPSYSKLMFDI